MIYLYDNQYYEMQTKTVNENEILGEKRADAGSAMAMAAVQESAVKRPHPGSEKS